MGYLQDAMKKRKEELASRALQKANKGQDEQAKQDQPIIRHLEPAEGLQQSTSVSAIAAVNGYSEMLVAHHDRGSEIVEEYRSLRTNLLAMSRHETFCYLVTSADAGEGKTVTCANLAIVMAELSAQKTVIIDGDLRKKRMASLLSAPSEPGLIEVVRGSATLKDCIQPTLYPSLFFIPSGKAKISEVGEIIGQPVLGELVGELRRKYDYVIFDAPPINIVSDAGALGQVVGEALLVIRMNKTQQESIDKAIRLLHAANIKLSGVILTHRKYYIPNYIYHYA